MNEASAELPEWPKAARMGTASTFREIDSQVDSVLLEDMMAARCTCTGPLNRCIPAECPVLRKKLRSGPFKPVLVMKTAENWSDTDAMSLRKLVAGRS